MTGRKITLAERMLNDPRWQVASEHPELNLSPPPLALCAQPDCVNTVIAGEADRCPFHGGPR